MVLPLRENDRELPVPGEVQYANSQTGLLTITNFLSSADPFRNTFILHHLSMKRVPILPFSIQHHWATPQEIAQTLNALGLLYHRQARKPMRGEHRLTPGQEGQKHTKFPKSL